jgi:hypothetical protein
MSNTEIASPKIFSADKTLGGGEDVPIITPGFNGTSKLLSIVRLNVNPSLGDLGVPTAIVAAPSSVLLSDWRLGCASSSATDDSTYRISWINKGLTSNYIAPGVINGVIQPVINAPQIYNP